MAWYLVVLCVLLDLTVTTTQKPGAAASSCPAADDVIAARRLARAPLPNRCRRCSSKHDMPARTFVIAGAIADAASAQSAMQAIAGVSAQADEVVALMDATRGASSLRAASAARLSSATRAAAAAALGTSCRGEKLERVMLVHQLTGGGGGGANVASAVDAMVRLSSGESIVRVQPPTCASGGRGNPSLPSTSSAGYAFDSVASAGRGGSDACREEMAKALSASPDIPRSSALADAPVCATSSDAVSVSVIVQYFRRPSIVRMLAQRIASTARALSRRKTRVEVLVNLDSQGSVALWYGSLGDSVEGYLVESGNVHEIRAYNRLVRMSRGAVTVLLQDDDMPPTRPVWVSSALRLLESRSDIGLLGGKAGTVQGGKWSGKYSPSLGRRLPNRLPLPSSAREPKTRLPLLFTTLVNLAPFAFRRNEFLGMGGFHANYSCRGEAGIGMDYELALRMWKSGLKVGLYEHGMRHDVGDSGSTGTRASAAKWRMRNEIESRNTALYESSFKGFYLNHLKARGGGGASRLGTLRGMSFRSLSPVHKLVTAANDALLSGKAS